ncbi:MAG: heme lyase CcmF/NrfE family subunit [Anaerolineales bacterium]|nr:heme lyase CcmF/NrfE family subunit [Anaerolineales bacterium]
MLANFGFFALLTAFGAAVYATVMALLGAYRRRPTWLASAHHAALLTWPLVTLACLSLIGLLVTDQYQVEYVHSVTSRAMPLYLKVTALWGGQAGSLLFWSWLMSTFAGLALLRKWERDRVFMPYVIAVMMITLGFFIGLIVFFENPFLRLWTSVTGATVSSMLPPAGAVPLLLSDGRGLNPLLRHPGMIIHPPMLYTGFVSFVVPYAFAMAALITRRADDEWIRTTRRWTLVGWLFLSLGLILGGRWAYDVLGWGGYWGWDPVENAAFLPWLTATAFLHSVMIQEKRGMLKKWNMVLIILTYSLVIFGTFLTRSGVLSSVHAFAQSAIGPSFFVFIGASFIASLLLLFREWEHLRSDHQLSSLLSRETAFMLNNLLFLGIAAVVFWGTVFPMLSELVTGQTITVGPPFYNQATGPLFAGLVLLMGIAPLMAWRQSSARQLGKLLRVPFALALGLVAALALAGIHSLGALLGFGIAAFVALTTLIEFGRGARARMRSTGENALTALLNLIARNRRRYGGYLIHLAVIIMTIGIIGSNFFQIETQGQLKPGEQLTLGRYVVTFDGLDEFFTEDGRQVARATVSVYRDGKFISQLHPRRDFYIESQQPMTIPGVRSTVEDDVYVLLVTWEPLAANGATFKIYVNPLINWVWMGGVVFILGTLVAAWPDASEARRRVTAPAATAPVQSA